MNEVLQGAFEAKLRAVSTANFTRRSLLAPWANLSEMFVIYDL